MAFNIKTTLALGIALALNATLLFAAPTISQSTLKSSVPELNEVICKLVDERKPIDPFGAVLANIHDFPADLRPAAKKELHFSDRLQVIRVSEESIADKIGLRPGDQLLQINSFYVTRGKRALEQFSDRIIPGVDWNEPIDTTFIRDGFGQSRSLNKSISES